MDITIKGGTLSGTVNSVASKSEAHRALICAALADRPTDIYIPSKNEDIGATINCLRAMGAVIAENETSVIVTPIAALPAKAVFNCAESGSTLRFLLPIAAALLQRSEFSGRGNLPNRPIGELISALEKNGVSISGSRLPMAVTGKLHAGMFEIAGDVSSQYISGLLMALPLLEGDSAIILTSPLCSEPYVSLTIKMLTKFGIEIGLADGGYSVRGGQSFRSPNIVDIEGDWSAAAFFLAAGAVCGDVTVKQLNTDSIQGDRAIIGLLHFFGAEADVTEGSVRLRKSRLKACCVDASAIPDLFPILAVLAACAEGRTVLYNASHLRYKESDRLKSTAAMINSLGGKAEEFSDRLEITGTPLSGGCVDSFGDHRIVMAAAIAAGVCEGQTVIHGAEAARKSYPEFFRDFSALGGTILS